MKFDGKVAIVTGGSRGIGRAIAAGFAKEGASVVVAAKTEVENPQMPGTIHKTAEEIRSLGGRALAIKCDVTNEQNVAEMVERTLAEFGRVDVLVNNAGTAFYFPVIETPLKRWEIVLKVNLTGAFLCSKAVLPRMMEQKSGCIINISSLAADERDSGTVPTGLAYAVAKAGLDRFTWGLATEVGRFNISVNCLKPKNVVDTEGMRSWVKEEERKGWVSPEKMVKCALLLASQDPVGITGVVATDEELSGWYGL
ncbi:MAG TPA: SDR family NAD(P)-dependent oxidoreductase [Syntrophorhabdales bacterium]|nr:SDR family NAD(P)-dependent oxidoreductase [Syntrophorhabdales bacterium]